MNWDGCVVSRRAVFISARFCLFFILLWTHQIAFAALQFKYYQGSWNRLPDFGSLTEISQGTVSNFDLSPRRRNDNFGIRFDANIVIQTAGTYRFYTTSDDGSRLWVNNRLIVDNDGLHGSRERSGSINLGVGSHAIRVDFFERSGSQTLSVRYSGPGISKRQIPASVLEASISNLNGLGKWGPVIGWPHIPVSASNLPDGRVLTWASNKHDGFPGGQPEYTHAVTWNPVNGKFLDIPHPSHDMFCAHQVMLGDGRVFVNGGRNQENSPWTSLFDANLNRWIPVANMNRGRWYPTSVATASSNVFTMIGSGGGNTGEIWSPAAGWKLLAGMNFNGPVLNYASNQFGERNWWPLLHLAPTGDVFHAGPTPKMHMLNTDGIGSIRRVGSEFRSWYPKHGINVMYDTGKILMAGGWRNGNTLASTNKAVIIDINGSQPVVTTTNPMRYSRKFHNAVMLPTGEALVLGGNTSGKKFNDEGSIYAVEIWNPETGQWRQGAAASIPRNYHSVALLLPDGRVFSGGGGLCGSGCRANHQDAQVYSPPYLFDSDGSSAVRPVVLDAADEIGTGQSFSVSVDEVGTTTKFSLIKMSSTTHAVNTDQRYLSIPFSRTGPGQYRLTMPGNPNVLTPGYWMLFAVNGSGVPSRAHSIKVKEGSIASPDNIARQGSARQSSTSNGGIASRAIDGIVDGNYTHNSVTHTRSDTNAWWELDLGSVRDIGSVRVWNRNDCCQQRMSDVYLLISDQPFASTNLNSARSQAGVSEYFHGGAVADKQDFAVNRQGRYIRVQLGGTNHLSLAEVEVFEETPDADLGIIGREWWTGINGDAVTDLKTAVDFPNHPAGTGMLTRFKTPTNWANNYGTRIRGYIHPPVTGAYRFWIASDDNSELLISTDSNPGNASIIAHVPDWTNVEQWNKFGSQASTTINLQAGQKYYIEASQKDGGGGDHLAVAWTIPGSQRAIVDGQYLSPFRAFTVDPIVAPAVSSDQVVNYTANANGTGLQYKWFFGDGSAETSYRASPNISHRFNTPGVYSVVLTIKDSAGTEIQTSFRQAIHAPRTALQPAISSTIVYESRAGDDRVWNVNPDNDSVSVFNADSHSKIAEIAVGKQPQSIAVAPDGRIWISNAKSGTLSIIDPDISFSVSQTITLGDGTEPYGIAFDPNFSNAYVVLKGIGQLVEIDAVSGAETARVDVGMNVRHVSITADGRKLYVSRFITPPLPGEDSVTPKTEVNGIKYGGEIIVIDAETFSHRNDIILGHSDAQVSEHSAPGIPNYLGPVTIAPDGLTAWVPSKQDNIKRGLMRNGENLDHDHTVRAVNSLIDLGNDSESCGDRVDFDNASITSYATFEANGIYLFASLEGNREVAVIEHYGREEVFRINVGRAPQGLVVSSDGTKLFVHNFMDRTISVHDISALVNENVFESSRIATMHAVSTEKLGSQILAGKRLFYDAKDTRLALESYMSCASCHNDGEHDGRVWDFASFGEGLRNTISLQGHGRQGPLHWTGNFDEVQDFEGQIRRFARGTGLMADNLFHSGTRSEPMGDTKRGLSTDLDELAAYVESLTTFADSPYRNADGSLSAQGENGKQVFINAGCADCHSGAQFTDSALGVFHDIGTIKTTSGNRLGTTLAGFDTPTLRGLWTSAPYLHDGSAPTLNDAVVAHTNLLISNADLNDLVKYLSQLDSREPNPVITNSAPNIQSPGNQTGTQGEVISLTVNAIDPDNDSLNFSATGLPTGLSINGQTGTINGTLKETGNFNVRVSVTDPNGASSSVQFSWEVGAQSTRFYRFKNLRYNRYLHENSSRNVRTSSTNDDDDTLWEVNTNTDGSLTFRNVNSGRFMDYDNDNDVDTYSLSNRNDRWWQLIQREGDIYQIRNVRSGRFLDADSSGGYNVDTQSSANSSDRWWQMIPIQR